MDLNATSQHDPDTDPAELRRRYVEAFHVTMTDIWHEKMARLGTIRTGALYRSLMSSLQILDTQEISHVEMIFNFYEYGVYVDRGTGRETPVGNPGDIGRHKVRVPRPWIHKKYYASLYNLRDFYLDSFRSEFVSIIDSLSSHP